MKTNWLKSVKFWIGLIVAVLTAAGAYFATQGDTPEPPPVVTPTETPQ